MSVSNGYLISSLDNKYYFRGGCVATGNFEKIYGPFFTYVNQGANGTEMWTDAKRQAEAEMAQWPYQWLGIKSYYNRVNVKGQIALTDGTSADSTWIILSTPDSAFGWQRDRGPYMFWLRTKADGSFELPNVRAGRYTLFANKEGVWGEFRKDNIDIQGQSLNLGKLLWTPDNHGKLLWQIGIPNRTSKEFRNGSNMDQWDNYHTYRPTFPNDVDFVIGKSDYRRDWNYIHPAMVLGEKNPTAPWKIHFTLDKVPANKFRLTIAISSTRDAFLNVLVNRVKLGGYEYAYGKIDDSAGIRTAAYGLYTTHVITINPSLLHKGENIITLAHVNQKEWSYVMYDCIKMEEIEDMSQ
jgi:rhamnogalacturonan endolyase